MVSNLPTFQNYLKYDRTFYLCTRPTTDGQGSRSKSRQYHSLDTLVKTHSDTKSSRLIRNYILYPTVKRSMTDFKKKFQVGIHRQDVVETKARKEQTIWLLAFREQKAHTHG